MISRTRAAALVLMASMSLVTWAAPEFPIRLQDPSTGQDVELVTGGKALHIVFFATWCQPCRQELAQLRDLDARWKERGYRLVIVAVRNRQSAERLQRFIEEHRPPGQLLFDFSGWAERSFAFSSRSKLSTAGMDARGALAELSRPDAPTLNCQDPVGPVSSPDRSRLLAREGSRNIHGSERIGSPGPEQPVPGGAGDRRAPRVPAVLRRPGPCGGPRLCQLRFRELV